MDEMTWENVAESSLVVTCAGGSAHIKKQQCNVAHF